MPHRTSYGRRAPRRRRTSRAPVRRRAPAKARMSKRGVYKRRPRRTKGVGTRYKAGKRLALKSTQGGGTIVTQGHFVQNDQIDIQDYKAGLCNQAATVTDGADMYAKMIGIPLVHNPNQPLVMIYNSSLVGDDAAPSSLITSAQVVEGLRFFNDAMGRYELFRCNWVEITLRVLCCARTFSNQVPGTGQSEPVKQTESAKWRKFDRSPWNTEDVKHGFQMSSAQEWRQTLRAKEFTAPPGNVGFSEKRFKSPKFQQIALTGGAEFVDYSNPTVKYLKCRMNKPFESAIREYLADNELVNTQILNRQGWMSTERQMTYAEQEHYPFMACMITEFKHQTQTIHDDHKVTDVFVKGSYSFKDLKTNLGYYDPAV